MPYYSTSIRDRVKHLRHDVYDFFNPRPHKRVEHHKQTPEMRKEQEDWWRDLRALDKEIEDEWPKSRRRKAIHCPFTGEKTVEPYPFSYKVFGLIEDGIKYRRRLESRSDVQGQYYFVLYDGDFRVRSGMRKTENGFITDAADMDVLLGFLRANDIPFQEVRFANWYQIFEAANDQWVGEKPVQQRYHSLPRIGVATLTEAQATYLGHLVKFVRSAIEYSYHDGKQKGKRFIAGLVTGETTIEDYNSAE